jgi:transposase
MAVYPSSPSLILHRVPRPHPCYSLSIRHASPGLFSTRREKTIHQHCYHGRIVIRSIREALYRNPSEIFSSVHALGAPKKITLEVTARIDEITRANRKMPSESVAQMISGTEGMPKISASSVRTVRHQRGYKFMPPLTTFPLTEDQMARRRAFASAHIDSDLTRTVFTDESSFVLESRGWIWRRRGET